MSDTIKALDAIKTSLFDVTRQQSRRLDAVEATLRAPGPSSLSGGAEDGIANKVWSNGDFKALAERGRGRIYIPLAELKTTITSTTVGSSTPGILNSQRHPEVIRPGVRRTRVRDLLRTQKVRNSAYDFAKENVYTNNASPQVEASAKEESALTFTIESVGIRTLAHWIPASKQILADFSELQVFLESRLIDGLLDIEDAQLLTGDGTGINLNGFTTVATAYDTGLNDTGDQQIDKVGNAIGQIEAVNLVPDGIILNPRDWRAMNKIKDQASGVGNYVLGGPANMASPNLWGLPVAVTTAMGQGTFLVGAFQTQALLLDRQEAMVEISTEHDTFFTRNLIALRAEERLGLAIFRDDGFVFGSF